MVFFDWVSLDQVVPEQVLHFDLAQELEAVGTRILRVVHSVDVNYPLHGEQGQLVGGLALSNHAHSLNQHSSDELLAG